MNTSSRTVRVFLSSTFRDFAEERELLVKNVFPELRRKCRERQVELIDVDLRWGIIEKESKQGKVLPICLAGIDRARPYFIGFLGNPQIERQTASGLPIIRNVLIDLLMADLQVPKGECIADLVRALLDPQPRLDLVLDDAHHQLRAGSFPHLPSHRETVGLGRPVTPFAVVAGKLFSECAVAAPDGLRDLGLGLSGLLHVGNHFTVFRAEAVVFIKQSQFVVQPN
jgi:hypothetical protein